MFNWSPQSQGLGGTKDTGGSTRGTTVTANTGGTGSTDGTGFLSTKMVCHFYTMLITPQTQNLN